VMARRRRGPVKAHRLRRHNRAILVKADQSTARRLCEKAAEAEREARH
jgi:E3 ubiquitin-protein ligase BOI and related proteins